MDIGQRLAEERARLGMNQDQFATAAGLKSRKTLYSYESGERSPDTAALAAWAALGVDVLYIITGRRAGEVGLSPREEALLANYRASDTAGKTALDSASTALAESGKQQVALSARKKAG